MQSDISFLRTREPPEPQGCLMEKSLNFLLPLANYKGYSRSAIRGTQRENSSKPLKHSIVKSILVFEW